MAGKKKTTVNKKKANPNSALAKARAKKGIEVADPGLVSGDAKDTVQNIENQHMDAVIGIDGKVRKGLLDPEMFDVRDMESLRPCASETERIARIMKEMLDKYYSRNGKFTWEIGFFLPGDPAVQGSGGWRALRTSLIGPHWTNEFKATAGLHEDNGAVCWSGRGQMERHIVCVMTTKLKDQMRTLHDKRTMEQFEQIETPGNTSGVQIDETEVKVPLNYDVSRTAMDDTGIDPNDVAQEA